MNRINQLFATKKRGILSIYFCAGYPTLDGTREIIKNLEQNGIDMIGRRPRHTTRGNASPAQRYDVEGPFLPTFGDTQRRENSTRTHGLPQPHHAIRIREFLPFMSGMRYRRYHYSGFAV